MLRAKLAAQEAATPLGSTLAGVRGVLFGQPLASEADITERLSKWKALPVFSSDAMSSVAYGPEAAMYTLLAAGTIAFAWLMPIMGVILRTQQNVGSPRAETSVQFPSPTSRTSPTSPIRVTSETSSAAAIRPTLMSPMFRRPRSTSPM